ncbi:hypothetical protein K438DRAFT_1938601 [Mycena galopus ATCC 62051]|nr:hypothetical protein K438DRAFT_1938601 [Mycena galopus ATCC 62051]
MLRLLDIFLALLNRLFPIFPHHAMFPRSHAAPVNANTEHEDEDTTDQNWYITSWGLISRNGKLLSHLREPSHDTSDDPSTSPLRSKKFLITCHSAAVSKESLSATWVDSTPRDPFTSLLTAIASSTVIGSLPNVLGSGSQTSLPTF